MEEKGTPFLTTPVAILLGSFVIATAMLINGGVIKLGQTVNQPTAQVQPQQPSQPTQANNESDIIKNLKTYAGKLGIDQVKFDSCLDSGSKEALVSADLADGEKVGVNGTPAFFINGRMISGAVPFEEFKKVIDEELAGNAPANTERKTVSVGNLPFQGDSNAKVTLIEFSDYQCPFCSRHFTQTEGTINKEYVETGKVKFYYRDFPLKQIHPGAQKAAEAARCAGDQSKYWQYHDLVFQNQDSIF